MDRTLPIDRHITVPFASLQRQLIEGHNLYKEGLELAEYYLKKPREHEHISFEALIEGDNEGWSYAVYSFYVVVCHCDWIKGEIVIMILKSQIIDPLENHINVACWKRKVTYDGVDYNLPPRSIIKSTKVLTQLLISPFHNHGRDILSDGNINVSFPNTNLFNVNI